MPEGAVYAGRGTKWGNPWRIERSDTHRGYDVNNPHERTCAGTFDDIEGARWAATVMYRSDLSGRPDLRETIRAELAGKDLACWCPLDGPCHLDVLLEIANGPAA
jgi:hypothetical protein